MASRFKRSRRSVYVPSSSSFDESSSSNTDINSKTLPSKVASSMTPETEVSNVKKRKFADMKAITLYVGEAQRAFYIHEDILFQSSGFFKTAFESNFREGSQRTMTLPDDKVEVFEDLVNWLYSQKYLIPSLTDRKKQKEAIDASSMLFVVSDKFDCPGLKTTICQQLLVMAKNGKPQPHPIAIEEMYTKIPVNSGMRKILTTWYTMLQASWYENEFVRSWLSKSPDFALDLMAALAGRLSTAAAFKWKADSEYID